MYIYINIELSLFKFNIGFKTYIKALYFIPYYKDTFLIVCINKWKQ